MSEPEHSAFAPVKATVAEEETKVTIKKTLQQKAVT